MTREDYRYNMNAKQDRSNGDKNKKSSWHTTGVIGVLLLCMIWLLYTALLLHLPSLSTPRSMDDAPANSEKSRPPMYYSLAHNVDPLRRTTCSKEMLFPATEELFNIVKHSSSWPHFTFNDRKLPLNMLNYAAQRIFTAKITQNYCDENRSDDSSCQKLAANIRKFDIPPDIHAMSGGGEGYVTGGLYNADMVLEGVHLAGGEHALKMITNGGSVLDWGGSSGRSISMMKAAFPLIDAHLADPIRKSIQWANVNIPNVAGYASPINPPTKYESKQFDLIFAISIWSHYNFGPGEKINGDDRGSAIRWLEEMRRIIKPNGYLVITTHGYGSVYSKVANTQTSELIMKAFEEGTGEFYVAAFPDNTDWDTDTTNPDWGMSWVDPGWLAEKTSGDWKIEVLLNSRNDCLQDVIVMRPIGTE